MTDTPTPPSPPPANTPLSDERQVAMIVYLSYVVALAFPPLAIAGLVLAYVSRETAPDWLKSHYTFQIHTFWIGLLYWVVALALCVVLIGIVLLLGVVAWWVVRSALGLNRLLRREAYPNPESWLT